MKTDSDLTTEAQKLVKHILSIGLDIPKRKPPNRHIGGIITDAVLQAGHKWKTHIGPRAERIRQNYPGADTFKGLFSLLNVVGAQKLLDWKGVNEQNRFSQTIAFFMKEKLNTFDDLRKWLESEDNWERLLTKSLRDDRAGIDNIAERTADYYRVLVGLPYAVKVDSRVDNFLKEAKIENLSGSPIERYIAKRKIVQLAAKMLGKRPIDLDGAIWGNEERIQKEEATNNQENPANVNKLHELCVSQAALKQAADRIMEIKISDLNKLSNIPEHWYRAKGNNKGKLRGEILTRIKRAKLIKLLGEKNVKGIATDTYKRSLTACAEYDALSTSEARCVVQEPKPGMAQTNAKYCIHCGQSLKAIAKYCSKCGKTQ
jgi:hypothetical protein